MDDNNFYSIRMHASSENRHVSGAERIVFAEKIDKTAGELIARAMGKGYRPDRVTVTIENLGNVQPRALRALDVINVKVTDYRAGRAMASQTLQKAEIAEKAVSMAIQYLETGAASGQNMRGAMIMDASTGERLEPDSVRGVRASRFDWSENACIRIKKQLEDNGLFHFRTYEALALATKIAHGPGVLAELCWSDDPDYTAGYAASLRTGYVRFPFLKEKGDNKGGRAIFVDRSVFNNRALLYYLQTEAVLISGIGTCSAVLPADYSVKKMISSI